MNWIKTSAVEFGQRAPNPRIKPTRWAPRQLRRESYILPSLTTRYATFGSNDTAKLDEGAMWPVAFALKELTAAEEARIGALVKRA